MVFENIPVWKLGWKEALLYDTKIIHNGILKYIDIKIAFWKDHTKYMELNFHLETYGV